MKKSIITTIFIFCLVGGTLFAQSGTNSYFDLGGGLSLLQGPDFAKDVWKDGFCGGVSFGFDILPILSIGFIGEFNRFGLDEDGLFDLAGQQTTYDISGVEIDGGEVDVMAAWAVAKVNIIPVETGFRPYAIGGLGYAYYKINDLTVSYQGQEQDFEGTDDSGLSLALGAGFEMKFSPKFALFGEGKYIIVFTNEDDTIDLEDIEDVNLKGSDDDIKFLPIKVGFRFFF